MIPLRLKVEAPPVSAPLVVRLGCEGGPHDAALVEAGAGACEFDLQGFGLRVSAAWEDVEGDVLLLSPGRDVAHRLIRARSAHNTFLVTEQCDQLCRMCSQPPKPHHVDLFDAFTVAARLAPEGATIGISGGEPTLHKVRLFNFLAECCEARPDLQFHILTNGQHFAPGDLPALRALPPARILWGVPLYAREPALHDDLVGKPGAQALLFDGLALLASAGARIELRTVLMRPNAPDLPRLAQLVSTHLPFISVWAIMQLENIGFARRDWGELFFDHGADPAPLVEAVDLARLRGVETQLYNMPLCTLPARLRAYAPATISDWKRRFQPACEGCSAREACSGFFEWHPRDGAYAEVRPQ